ncbi:hypothetical protein DPX16_4252 [Anabarilius grahami]|uniref:Uncharacterized protein n=1 Tax=Anabarilius grahami TaxID=495550 RepID=A0A3N0YWJ3_ANAGA|nr:hypothetical protein DPX16_4252 [Anabarilius grahami]
MPDLGWISDILSIAVEELGLYWSPSEEPTCSCLDEWYLPGHHQASRQRAAPFFLEVHDELTKSLTTVVGSEEKGYKKLPPLDESVAAHLCPPAAIGWKAKTALPSKPCRTTSTLVGHIYSSAGQAASVLHTMAILQVF